MKTSELITQLAKAMTDSGTDPEVVFDTEAAEFDYHWVAVTGVCLEDELTVGRDTIVLSCDNEFYIHRRREP